jgi:tetratricopeptide (TPR) repeat protein
MPAGTRVLAGLLAATSLTALPTMGLAVQLEAAAKPDPAATYIAGGIRLLRNRDTAAAKVQFSAAVRANPRSADALTWRGIAENQLKQYREAVVDLEAALRIDSTALPAHYNLALSLIRTGQADSAIEQLKIVVKAQPGMMEPEYNLAILLEETHATAEAIEHLQAAYKSSPDDVGVGQHLLVDLLAMGRKDEAQLILERMLTITSVEARQQVGAALIEAGDYAQAIVLFESVRAQSGPSREPDMLLARAYLGAREDYKAIDLLKPAENDDSTGETAYLLGLAYTDAGATEDARVAFEFAAKKNPRNGRALYSLGMIESGNPDQLALAISHLQGAIRLEPGNSAYGIELGKLLLQHDDAREALAVIQRVHAEGLEAGERDLLLGIAQIIVNGSAQAVPTLERAALENPSLALSHNMLGFCLLAQGDMAKAAASYGKASDLDQGSRIFAHGAAVAFDRSNDADQAMVYAARAVALPGANGEDHYLFGKLLAKTGRHKEAIRELNEAIVLNPDLEEAYYLLARAYMQTGDNTQATEWIARLKDLKQTHEHAYVAAKKNTRPITSSTLMQGAPTAGAETGTQ